MSGNSNQHYIEKADMAVADLTAGGLLVPEQAKQFMELMILKSKLLQLATTKTMASPTYEIPKLGFTGEVLKPAVEGQALVEGDRSKPVTDKTTLETVELIAECRWSYSVIEDNIQNGSFDSFLKSQLSAAVARDVEKVVIQGDTSGSGSALLKSMDGVLKLAQSHTVDAGGVRLNRSILEGMSRTMPAEYFDEVSNMAIMTSKNAVIDYNASLANRTTPLGDSLIGKLSGGDFGGIGVVSLPLMPENQSSNKTSALLCDPKNIWVGFHRDITVEAEKDIKARVYIVVVTMRVGVEFAHEPAVVKAYNILASA